MRSATLWDPLREQPVDGDEVEDAVGSGVGAVAVMRSATLWDPVWEQ